MNWFKRKQQQTENVKVESVVKTGSQIPLNPIFKDELGRNWYEFQSAVTIPAKRAIAAEVATKFHSSQYLRAQKVLRVIIRQLARCRTVLRVVKQVSKRVILPELFREVQRLQPLYRSHHTTAYAFGQLLRVAILPALPDYYSIGCITVIPTNTNSATTSS